MMSGNSHKAELTVGLAEFISAISEMNVRPHPGPLPRGEGGRIAVFEKSYTVCCDRRAWTLTSRAPRNKRAHTGNTLEPVPPLLGERAGVRASAEFNFYSWPLRPLRAKDL
jgi:hypothetical protein